MKINKIIIVFFAFWLIFGAAGLFYFKNFEKNNPVKTLEQPNPSAGEEVSISWERAVEMINKCEVIEVAQTHNLSVGLGLQNGKFKSSKEPKIDEVLIISQQASEKCGFKIETSTE